MRTHHACAGPDGRKRAPGGADLFALWKALEPAARKVAFGWTLFARAEATPEGCADDVAPFCAAVRLAGADAINEFLRLSGSKSRLELRNKVSR
jgi:hypothetical protein